MPMSFHITDSGTPMIVGELLMESGEKAVKGMQPVMKSIFIDMLLANEANIRSGGRRGGGSYAQLKPMTIDRKGTGEILYTRGARTGYTDIGNDALVNSVTQYGRKYQHRIITKDRVELGTNRPYAGTHQYGHRGKPNIPRRPFLAYTKHDVEKWERLIADHLMSGFKKAEK